MKIVLKRFVVKKIKLFDVLKRFSGHKALQSVEVDLFKGMINKKL